MFKWKTKNGIVIRLIKAGITNCYLVEDNKLRILVDTGQKKASSKMITRLIALLDIKNVLDYILLTHTHYDHSDNARVIKDEFGAKLIVHKKGMQNLQQGYTQLPKGTNFITNLISSSGNKFAKKIAMYDSVEADIVIEGNQLIENNPYFNIIETPGHTSGSISLIVDNEIAIVGDTLFGVFMNSVLPPFANDENILFESWEKLLNTPCNLFLPGHGKSISRKLLEKEYEKKAQSIKI